MPRRVSGRRPYVNHVAGLIYTLLWGLAGIAKAVALVLLLTAADTHWRDALAWLALAFGLVAVALMCRTRRLG